MGNNGQYGRVYSGRIIGAIVKALDLEQGVLKERTARRFFDGQPVNEHNLKEIFLALGEALVERGIVPVPHLFQQKDISMPEILAEAIAYAGMRWDRQMARIQSRLILRTIAWQPKGFSVWWLLIITQNICATPGRSAHPPETPMWAEENGGGKLLSALAKIRPDPGSIGSPSGGMAHNGDNWMDGKNRPTSENVAALAKVLAGRNSETADRQLEQAIQPVHFRSTGGLTSTLNRPTEDN